MKATARPAASRLAPEPMRNRNGPLIVCEHAIWQNGAWWDGYFGERPVLDRHVRDGRW